MKITEELIEQVKFWIADDPDESTAALAQENLEKAITSNDQTALENLQSWFGPFIQFGTAGLRGPIAPGPSCMNRAVVSRAAAGFVAYLKQNNAKRIVVGFDARHKSLDFALDTVAIASGAGLEAILLPRPLPTPILAFAVNYFKADGAVMVTASHNPAADNGYKVFLGNGCQIVPPTDTEISDLIGQVQSVSSIPLGDSWYTSDDDVVDAYLATCEAVVDKSVSRDITIASTSLHGVGHETWLSACHKVGFKNVHVVQSQAIPDPDFPTVPFPNPEEAGACDLLLELAKQTNADIAIAHDPDADRCAAGILENDIWRLLTGDELGGCLAWWEFERTKIFNLPKPVGTLATSIVSASLLEKIAMKHGVKYQATLTGFKWIGRIPHLIFGYEEAIGYCVDSKNVKDKDGITAGLRIAELVGLLKHNGKTIATLLQEIAAEYGLHYTTQLSIRMNDMSTIPSALENLKTITHVGKVEVLEVIDMANGLKGLLPTSGIYLQLTNGKIIVRPSGTEPKLKAYIELVAPLTNESVTNDSLTNNSVMNNSETNYFEVKQLLENQAEQLKVDIRKTLGV
jgi:phosphomannomutase